MTELKDLKKLILLCRQQGVQSIRFNGVELHLNELPQAIDKRKYPDLSPSMPIIPGGVSEHTKIVTDELTDEQLLFYSSSDNQEQHS